MKQDNKVFATQRGCGKYKDWWEFPGGKVESDETPEEWQVDWLPADIKAVEALEEYYSENKGCEVISSIVWKREDVSQILKDNNIEESDENIDRVVNAFEYR